MGEKLSSIEGALGTAYISTEFRFLTSVADNRDSGYWNLKVHSLQEALEILTKCSFTFQFDIYIKLDTVLQFL